jgi:Domain of unknown function (DUF1918)
MRTGFEPLPDQVAVGDRLVVRAHRLGQSPRDAEILEILGDHGSPPYRVRWQEDGYETIVYPGSDVFIEHLGRDHARPLGERATP